MNDGANTVPEIHTCHLAVKRYGKGLLVDALKVGAELQKVRRNRGDDFNDWVDKETALSREEAECYIRFFEESGCDAKQLLPTIEVKLPRICEWLRVLSDESGKGSATKGATENTAAGSKQSKATAIDNDCESPQRDRKPTAAARETGKTVEPKKKRTNKAAANAQPVEQFRDCQAGLTDEQEQFLLTRSPKLLLQVNLGELSSEQAIRMAEGLPDRNSLPPTQVT